MFFKSDRIKNQKKTRRIEIFENKFKNIPEESIVKISIVFLCVLAYLFISFIYPNLFAWQNRSPSSSGQLEMVLPGRINNDYYRVLTIELSKNPNEETRNISDVRIISVDKVNAEINSYSIPLDSKVNYSGSEITVSELYSKDYDHFVQTLENSLLIRTEYALVFNDDHLKKALDKYSISESGSKGIQTLLQLIQSDNFGFFKQEFWGNWYTNTVTNQKSSEFRAFLDDLKNSKPIKFKAFSSDKLKNNILSDPRITKEQLRVEISNSSDHQGLATDYAKTFENLGITISKVSNFDFISYQNLVFIPKEYENTVTFLTIKSMVGDAKFLYESPTKFSTADILVVVAK